MVFINLRGEMYVIIMASTNYQGYQCYTSIIIAAYTIQHLFALVLFISNVYPCKFWCNDEENFINLFLVEENKVPSKID